MFNVVFGPGYWPLNIYPGRLFTGFTNILRFPHRTSASAMTCRIKSGEYCAPMSDVITICLNFELNEVRLIGAANSRNYGAGRKFEFLSATAMLLCLNFSVWKWLKGVSCSDKMRPVGIGNGSLKIPSILWTFSICGMGDNLKDLWRVMAAIYNFTQVPLTLPLEAAVKNRHGRRVIRGGRRRRNGKRG